MGDCSAVDERPECSGDDADIVFPSFLVDRYHSIAWGGGQRARSGGVENSNVRAGSSVSGRRIRNVNSGGGGVDWTDGLPLSMQRRPVTGAPSHGNFQPSSSADVSKNETQSSNFFTFFPSKDCTGVYTGSSRVQGPAGLLLGPVLGTFTGPFLDYPCLAGDGGAVGNKNDSRISSPRLPSAVRRLKRTLQASGEYGTSTLL